MSLYANFCMSLQDMIKTYPNEVQSVVHTFYSMVSKTDLESDDIVNMLKSCKGISEIADIVLDHFINRELNPNK